MRCQKPICQKNTRISKTHPLPMSAHPLAGKPAPKDLLIDVNKFEEAFYASKPDPPDVNQLVSFGDIAVRLFTIDLALESALSRVVLEQICEIVRRNEI